MRRLSQEFHHVLSSHLPFADHAESVSSQSSQTSILSSSVEVEYDSEDELATKRSVTEPVMQEEERVPNAAASDLQAIADCMIACGYGKECIEVYKTVRRSIVDKELHHLGFERPIKPWQMQKMDWEVLEAKIKSWLSAVKPAVHTLFYSERILCDQVFTAASASVRESVFSHAVQDAAVALFEFTEGAAKAIKRSPERIFPLLDLYEAVVNLWPGIKSTFSSAATSAVRSRAINSLIKLGEAVRVTLGNFEVAIHKDSSNSKQPAVSCGSIHPLTRHVMNYLALLADYDSVLTEILANGPIVGSPKHLGFPESYFASCDSISGNSSAPATFAQFAWLVLVLLCKLDVKAEQYKDVALSYIFLANNLRYVVNKVARSRLRHLLGEDWVAKHESKAKLYASSYERTGWSKVFASLAGPRVEISSAQAKELLREFNAALEEVQAKHAGWALADQKLRDEIASSLAEKLVPAYRRLYHSCPRGDPVVKFTPDDLDNYLAGMLRATATGGGSENLSTASSRSSSHSPSPVGQDSGQKRLFRKVKCRPYAIFVKTEKRDRNFCGE